MLLLIFGLVLSVGIDSDVVFSRGINGHHKLLTHYPLFWLAVSLGVFGLGVFADQAFIQSLALVIVVAAWTHLALDLFGLTMGVHLLWPVSMSEYSLTPLVPSFATGKAMVSYLLQNPRLLFF